MYRTFTERAARICAALTVIGLALFTMSAAATVTAGSTGVTVEFTGSDFYIPRPVEAADPADLEPRLVATLDLAAHGLDYLIDSTCRFNVTAANGSSVHPNEGLLTTNGDSTRILDTENQPDVLATRLTDANLKLGPVVYLYNLLIPDQNGRVATSVDYVVTFTCEVTPSDTTTTTTEADTTTTSQDSTTTSSSPSTTTTTAPTTSTSTSTTSTTTPTVTTTAPPTTSTTAPPVTTTAPPVTTSSLPPGTTTTTGPTTSTTVPPSTTLPPPDTTTTTVPTVTTSTLPFTGFDLVTAAAAGLALMVGGAGTLATVTAVSAIKTRRAA